VIGVLLSVVSALSPARRATRVRPVAALAPTDNTSVVTRKGVARSIIALTFVAAGGMGLVVGATGAGLRVALLSGIVCFLGVLMASPLFIPWAVRTVGLLIAWISVPARLASLNATRNPTRIATTAAALLVGVTFVTMMVIGTFSARESLNDQMDQRRPIDLIVESRDPQGFTESQVNTITALQGIDAATTGYGGKLTITPEGQSSIPLIALGLDPGQTLHVARVPEAVPKPGHILFHPSAALNMQPGQSVTVAGADSRATFLVEISRSAMSGEALLTTNDLQLVNSKPVASKILLRLPSEVTDAQVQQKTTEILSLNDKYSVEGGVADRVYYGKAIDSILLTGLGLLAITVIIAFVGIGNTMALSVIERRRESALLRALGLTTRQLRGMLATEAGLIAAVAALVGVALGIVYSWAGLSALSIEMTDLPLNLSLPWTQLAFILGGTLLAGLGASILSARNAAKQSPIEGLAHD